MSNKEYQFLFGGIIPATQEAYNGGVFSPTVRKHEKACVVAFKKIVSDYLSNHRPSPLFPTANQVYVGIIQFYTSYKNNYNKRDVDNMAKTMLDTLKENNFYSDDSQVRTLLVSKIVDRKRVQQDIGFVYIKILNDGEDIKFAEDIILRAVEMYGDIKVGEVNIS